MTESNSAENQIREILASWAKATRQNRKDDVLEDHASDAVIFDVLPPMKYESAESYRRSWDEWQPDTLGEGQFDVENLVVTAGSDVAFAHCFIRCGGTLPNGRSFEDLVRATFCFESSGDRWRITHQHISKPLEHPSS